MAPLPPFHGTPHDLPLGFLFTPVDEDLLAVYLRRKPTGELLLCAAGKFFHDANICAADPATLTGDRLPAPATKRDGRSWFFFTHARTKTSRGGQEFLAVGDSEGTWLTKRTGARVVLDGKGRRVGRSQMFSYRPKNDKRSDWYMVEFAVDDQDEDDEDRSGDGESLLVLCKIYQSPRCACRTDGSVLKLAPVKSATSEYILPVY
ncbi:NAC domain-containing protein 14-like [Phragmites australis]|uniref:NAC domain-containing protein 14-like n=1 Tax=Phragmites australis TaxID=29695 RepID=UPI002D76DBB7|nr:NAC domain-containing protein 14-like [Phragmites australis]